MDFIPLWITHSPWKQLSHKLTHPKPKWASFPAPKQTRPPRINEITITVLTVTHKKYIKVSFAFFLFLNPSSNHMDSACSVSLNSHLSTLYYSLTQTINSHLTCFSNISHSNCHHSILVKQRCNHVPHSLIKDLCSSPLQSKIFRLTFKALTM